MVTTDDRRPQPISPTAANPLQVLIAGGPADVARELKAWLAPRGLRVTNAWPSERGKPGPFDRPIPAGTDLVIILVAYLGHEKQGLVIASCKRAGVRFIRSAWNRTRLTARLADIGITLAAPRAGFDPAPLHEEPDAPPRPPRCVFTESGRRCSADAAADDTLCAAHRARFDASRSSPPLRVGGPKPAAPTLCLVPPQLSTDAVAKIAAVSAAPSAAAPAADAPPVAATWSAWPAGYVKPPSKAESGWAPAHVEHLTRLVEAGSPDAAKLVADLHAATGVYRPAGGLGVFLRPLTAVGVKAHPALLSNLEKLGKAQTEAKRAADAAEADELRHGRTPELLSRAAAARLLGGVAHRLGGLEFRLETATGRLVYRRADVAARQAELEARAGGALDATPKLKPVPKTDDTALATQLVDALRDGHGWGVCTLAKRCHVDRPRVEAALKRLAAAGAVESAARPGRLSDVVWGLTGFSPAPFAPPPGGKRHRPAPAPVAAPPAPPIVVAVTTPAVPADPVVAAVIEAINSGRLDAAKGAAVLAALRSKP